MNTSATADRRRFLLGAGGAAVLAGAAAVAPAGLAQAASQPRRRPLATAIAVASGSDNTVLPPLAVRVLHRAGFGPRRLRMTAPRATVPDRIFAGNFELLGQPGEDDVGYFMSLGGSDEGRIAAWVEEQLDPNLPDPELNQRMTQHAASFPTLNRSLASVWSTRECNGFSEYSRPTRDVERAAFTRAIYSRRQLFELMADFWHNHFNVFAGLSEDTYVGFADWDRNVIRKHAFGNFYNMVYASAKHPVMLRYLDNYRNGDGGGINENYARELFELHTMGAMNYAGLAQPLTIEALAQNPYTALNDAELNDANLSGGLAIADASRQIGRYYVDEDVYSTAAAVSGWRYDDPWNAATCGTGAFYVDQNEHLGNQSKTVLGRGVTTMRADLEPELSGRLAIKMAAYHPGTARHIAYKLCQRLIADEPPTAVVDAAEAEFFLRRKHGDQIAPTLRVILNHANFRDPALWGSKTKRPFEYVVSAMRAAGAEYTFRPDDHTSDDFFWTFRGTGQQLFWWRTPDGYPDHRSHWQGSQTLVQSWRCIDWLLDRNWDNPSQRVMRPLQITLENLAGNPTPREMVAFWLDWILGFTPDGGWVGPVGTTHQQAPTVLGRSALQFITQQYLPGEFGLAEPDSPVAAADYPVSRSELSTDSWPNYWSSRLRNLVAMILWSPNFMQR